MPQIMVTAENLVQMQNDLRAGRLRVVAVEVVTKGDEAPRRELDMSSPAALADSLPLVLFDQAVHGIGISIAP